MALPFAYRAPAPPMFASGQSQQNQLYQALSSSAPGTRTPDYSHVSDVRGGVEQASTNDPSQTVYTPWQQAAPTAAVDPTTHQPPPTTTDTSGGGGGGGGGGNGVPLDFSGDPILAQIRALNAQNVSNAESAALARRKQAEIGYGYDPAFQYEDQSTQQAAQQNPFSTLAQLGFNHGQRSDALTENLNKANLFYSGERIKQTGLEGRQYTLENANANSQLQNLMGQIAQGVLDAKQQAQQSELSGEQAAYDRAVQFALANNTGYPGGSGGQGGATGGNSSDWIYGSTLPQGLSGEQALSTAASQAPTYGGQKYVPAHIMDQGQTFHDSRGTYIHVKFVDPTGKNPPSTENVYVG